MEKEVGRDELNLCEGLTHVHNDVFQSPARRRAVSAPRASLRRLRSDDGRSADTSNIINPSQELIMM